MRDKNTWKYPIPNIIYATTIKAAGLIMFSLFAVEKIS